MNRFAWSEARTVQEAIAQAGEGVLFKAGGVDLVDRLKEGLDAPKQLVNIRNVKELSRLTTDASGLRIGPLVTLAQLDADANVRRQYTALADAAGHAATPQIRNMATVGGNLLQRPRCWYFRSQTFHCLKKGGNRCFAQDGENEYHAIFDNALCAIVHPSATAAALIALGATIELTSGKGKRQAKLEEFFTLPTDGILRENSLQAGELLTEIRVPTPKAGARSAYMKLGEKESFDWPLAEVAVVLEQTGGKVAKANVILGAASPIPRRAKEAEAALMGKTVSVDTATAAAKAALTGATPLARNGYKLPIFEAVIRRTILAAAGVRNA
ncbi:MAG: FAD binding domain-containing protein [Terriglobales bacterium]